MAAFDVRIYKSFGARNRKAAWVNNYVINHTGDVTSAGWTDVINGIAAAERLLHADQVQYLHATVSTTANEPVYDPKSLRIFELEGAGGRNTTNDPPLDLNITLKAKKRVAYGRSGTMFYRGALLKSDVDINDRGESQISPVTSALNNPVFWANVNIQLNGIPEGFTWVMMHPSLNDPNPGNIEVRNVLGLQMGGVSLNPRDHKYFDLKNKVAAPAQQ